MKSFNEYTQDLISRDITEICARKHIKPYYVGKFLGIKDTIFTNAEKRKAELTLEHGIAFCLFLELSTEEARSFLEHAGYSITYCEPYITFLKHLECKDYGLLSFVLDVKNMIEKDNIFRISNGIKPVKISRFYYIKTITNISYSDCLDVFGNFSYDIGNKLLENQSIK